MKRIISILLAALTGLGALAQEGHLRERTLLTTDRSYYAAGESIKCSAFCLQAPGEFSNFSSIAYLEVYGNEGTVATGKVALVAGRGGCSIDIPADVPTGNYRIAAYTAVNKNEEAYDFNTTSKVISIFNTGSSAREKDAVTVVSEKPEVPAVRHTPTSGLKINIEKVEEGLYKGSVTSDKDATISISVWNDEGFDNYDNFTLGMQEKVVWNQPTTHRDNVTGEYDGEIVYARLKGLADTSAIFLASPGSRSDIYKGHHLPDGRTAFYTDNIYGNKDIAIISMSGRADTFEAEIESPFTGIKAAYIPSLQIYPSMKEGLASLDASLKIEKAFDADTLYSALKVRKLDLLGPWQNRYVLDDYTRFVTMREVFIEYLHDIHIEREKNQLFMNVKTTDVKGLLTFRHAAGSLILLDGVPVTDHSIIYEMDPMLVKYVEIYPNHYAFGETFYSGAANFVTFKGDLAGVQLGRGNRILSFKGASIPMVYSAVNAAFDPDFPAITETLYWNPLATVKAGQPLEFYFAAPGYDSSLKVTAEGFTSDGKPIIY